MGKKIKKYGHLNFMLLFPILFLYYEIIYRIGVADSSFDISILYLTLFSIAYGGVAYLLASIAKSTKVNRIITAVFIGVAGLIYVAEYLVREFFKIPYSIETVLNGAGGVATTYASETISHILGGIPVILLYVAPLVLYLIFGKKYLPAFGSNAYVRIIAGAVALITFVLSSLLVSANSIYSLSYKDEYSFQKAVDSFGLATGLRLDIKYLITGREVSFGSAGNEVPSLNIDNNTGSDPVVYGKNELDINFEEKSKGASSAIKSLNSYVSSLQASSKNQYTGMFKGKNLIMITAEAFTAEVIDPTLTPTLYRLATKGIQFTDFYQPASAGTTGGEYQNIFGMLPMAGGSSFSNTSKNLNWYTMGSQLNRLGYYGKAFHNNSYTYYSRNVTHTKIGYSDGFMGYGNGMEQYVKHAWPQSDLEMLQGTLPTYIDKQPFNVYYMSVSGHNGYSQSGNSMTKKNWDRVKHLNYSDDVKGYLAANLELEDALAYTVRELEAKGIADDTVIVICTDHFPYGLDNDAQLGDMDKLSELYGYNVTNYFQRDHNRLIIWSGSLENSEPIVVSSPTFSLDILPTLSNLFGTEFDSRLMPGRDVLSDAPALVYNTNYDWKTDFGTYYASSGKFKPNEGVACPDGFKDWDEYVKYMKDIVRNKINFSVEAPKRDYYRHIFG